RNLAARSSLWLMALSRTLVRSGHPQFLVRLVIRVPDGGGICWVKQNPRAHGGDVTVAKKQIVIFSVPRGIESKFTVRNWQFHEPTTNQAAFATWNSVNVCVHEPGFTHRQHFTRRFYLGFRYFGARPCPWSRSEAKKRIVGKTVQG